MPGRGPVNSVVNRYHVPLFRIYSISNRTVVIMSHYFRAARPPTQATAKLAGIGVFCAHFGRKRGVLRFLVACKCFVLLG